MMSEVRARQLIAALTSTQRKAFDVIPIREAWTFQQINAELQRQGVQMRFDIFQGSVASLKETGLVQEPTRGSFVRAPIREAPLKYTTESAMDIAPITTKPKDQAPPAAGTPLQKLEALATRVKKLADVANMLVMEAKEIAESVEDVGLEIEERAGAESKELTKLRQLRELLRGD